MELAEISESVLGLTASYVGARKESAKSGNDLEIDDVRSGEAGSAREALSDPVPALTAVDEVVDRRRRVEDDQ